MIFEKLSRDDLDMVKTYIYNYAECINSAVQWERMAPLETILAPWENGKGKYLYQLMGQKLIIETEIEYECDADTLKKEIRQLLNRPDSPEIDRFYASWSAMINSHEKDFRALDRDAVWALETLISDDNILVDNRWSYDSVDIQLPNRVFHLQEGTKVMRAIGKIAKAYDIPNFQDFCNKHSLILNQKKLTGTLCISIHPLDYMTMSDNECDWDSCMSWIHAGSFRQGTVEMMNSPCVVVAYLKAKEDMEIDKGLYWSNKKWRELFIVSRDIITNILGYPYVNKHFSRTVLDILKELAEKNCGYHYQDGIFTREHMPQGGYRYKNKVGQEVDFHFETDNMYNDTAEGMQAYITVDSLDDSKQKENSAINWISRVRNDYNDEEGHSKAYINYSGPAECMICGSIGVTFEDESELCCDECMGTEYCDCCGCEMPVNSAIEVDGEKLCPECYDDYVVQCTLCGDEHIIDGGCFVPVELSLVPLPEGHLIDDTDKLTFLNRIPPCAPVQVCKTCMANHEAANVLLKPGQSFKYTLANGDTIYWVTLDMLSDKGLEFFYANDPCGVTFEKWIEGLEKDQKALNSFS